jgi:hypothetical protein
MNKINYNSPNEILKIKDKLYRSNNNDLKNLSNQILIINNNQNLIVNNTLKIIQLYYMDDFNKKIIKDTLPITLEKLVFGYSYNNGDETLNNSLSNLNNLKELYFGNNFNQ